jgi:NADPH2:quinone reductase
MKAVRVEEFGEPEVLRYEDAERPEPSMGEVLVEVKSVGVNFADTMRRRNQYVIRQEVPFVPGSEVAGIVTELGEGVEGVEVGDRVVSLVGEGAYAEYALASSQALIPIPDGLDFDTAAAIPLQGLTAYHVLKTSGRLQEGESVVVHAAAGGVGTLAVQMAKIMGASPVIATASSQEKLDLARDLGADVLIDYTEEDWPEKVREATGGDGADVILEMVGGDFVQKNLLCMNAWGRMVVFGAASGDRGEISPMELLRKNHSIIGFFLPQVMSRPDLFVSSLQEMMGWISSGKVRLTLGASYKLQDAEQAHSDLEGRKTTGKIVLNP